MNFIGSPGSYTENSSETSTYNRIDANHSNGVTVIEMMLNYNPVTGKTEGEKLYFQVDTLSTGTFDMGVNDTFAIYTTTSGNAYLADHSLGGGSITITQNGAIGGRITGTYDIFVKRPGFTSSTSIDGSFDAVRTN